MRQYFFVAVMLVSANPALAQSYQPYTPPQPQQQANVTAYPRVPTTYPQAYNAPAPQPAAQPAPNNTTRPVDAGQAVDNEIRQMNF